MSAPSLDRASSTVTRGALAGATPAQAASSGARETPEPPDDELPEERDRGYGPSHGYRPGHGGPTGPGDAPAPTPAPGAGASQPPEPPSEEEGPRGAR